MNGSFRNKFLVAVILGTFSLFTVCLDPADAAVNVTQHHNHLNRDGLYIDPAFTVSNAAKLVRDTNFDGAIIGNVYAQPLYIEGGPRGRAVVIAVTESNYVFALDAITGVVVWSTNVAPDVAANSLPCGNISPYGITGTPVVDLPSRSLFFDAFTTRTNGAVTHMIYSLDVDTGSVNPGWPVNVDSNAVFGKVRFASLAQGQRDALTVVGTNVYVPYGGLYRDCGTYYGWVVGVAMSAPTNVMAWATTAARGGIWGVSGIASDGTDIYVTTGNTSSPAVWGGGEAVIHLLPNVVLTNGTANYWAPTNWPDLDNKDLDLAGTGPMIVDLPGASPSNLVVALGKDGNCYLLNRTNLGGIRAPVAQAAVSGSSIIQAAVNYPTTNGAYVVFANSSFLYAFLIGATNPPTIKQAWSGYEGGGGSPFVTSTDGASNFIVWGIGAQGNERLYAFDGITGSNIFSGGGMTSVRNYNTAIVARGHIYVANDNRVYSFTVPGITVSPIVLTNSAVLPSGAFQFAFTNTPNINFNVFGTTNLADPFTNWVWLGEPSEIAPGQYEFTDSQEATNAERFYLVNTPE